VALWTTRPDADFDLLRRAYEVAARCHQGQFRRSGDPYVTHPVSVATILAGLGADDVTLCAVPVPVSAIRMRSRASQHKMTWARIRCSSRW
jgi:HD domain